MEGEGRFAEREVQRFTVFTLLLLERVDAYYDVDDGKPNLPSDIMDAVDRLRELVK